MQLPQQPPKHSKPFIREDLVSRSMYFSIADIQSRMSLMHPYALDLEYTRLMMGFLVFVPDPRRITMIGLGGGSLAKFCYRYLPQARVEVLEINPHVLELRKEFHVPRNNRRFRVIEGDGTRFVAANPGHCDALLIDGFDCEGQPENLCSRQFYDDARDSLRPGGVLAVNLHAGHPSHEVHLERLRDSFGGDVLEVDSTDSNNCIVFARVGGRLSRSHDSDRRRTAALAPDGASQLQRTLARVAAAAGQRNTHERRV
jgi:spermidine synthase